MKQTNKKHSKSEPVSAADVYAKIARYVMQQKNSDDHRTYTVQNALANYVRSATMTELVGTDHINLSSDELKASIDFGE